MPAIVSDGDHICLQFRKFSKYLESDRLGSKRDLKKFEIAGINGPHQIRLQAYLVPTTTKVAGIIGPPYKCSTKLKKSIKNFDKIFKKNGHILGLIPLVLSSSISSWSRLACSSLASSCDLIF